MLKMMHWDLLFAKEQNCEGEQRIGYLLIEIKARRCEFCCLSF